MKPITGKDVAALLHGIHDHAELIALRLKNTKSAKREDAAGEVFYAEKDLLPVLGALGLPEPEWGESTTVEDWLKKREKVQPAAPLSSLPDWQDNAVKGAKELGILGGPPLAAFMDGAEWMLQQLQAENTRLREQLQAVQPAAAQEDAKTKLARLQANYSVEHGSLEAGVHFGNGYKAAQAAQPPAAGEAVAEDETYPEQFAEWTQREGWEFTSMKTWIKTTGLFKKQELTSSGLYQVFLATTQIKGGTE